MLWVYFEWGIIFLGDKRWKGFDQSGLDGFFLCDGCFRLEIVKVTWLV
jgi:hypothetical protein